MGIDSSLPWTHPDAIQTKMDTPAASQTDGLDMDDQDFPLDHAMTRGRSKTRWAVALFSLMVILSLSPLLFLWLHEEVLYFFRSGNPTDLGRSDEMGNLQLRHNDFVRLEGIARDMCIRADRFWKPVKFLYLLGSKTGARLVVEAQASKDEACLGAVDRVFEGRLTHLEENGKYKHVLTHYRTYFSSAPKEGVMYLLQDGRHPRTFWMIPLLFLIILFVWIINVRTLWRLRSYKKT